MKLNWTAIIASFLISLILSVIFGIYLPKNVELIAPVIGGLIAGYMVGTSYTDGLVNGGIPAGIAGIISTVTIVLLNGNVINSAVQTLGYTGSTQSLLVGLIVGSAFVGFALFFVLGIIGSVIGVAIKNGSNKPESVN